MKDERQRRTSRKAITSAPTFAQKWRATITGGRDETEAESIVFESFGLRRPSLHGEVWQAGAEERLKARFADTFFPALMRDDRKAFKDLISLMQSASVHKGNIIDYLLEVNRVDTPLKKRMLKLRRILMHIPPENRLTLKDARTYLDRSWPENQIEDSQLWHTLNGLNLPLFKPGDRVQWFKKGKLVREIQIERNGKFTNNGLTRLELDSLGSVFYRELIPSVDK